MFKLTRIGKISVLSGMLAAGLAGCSGGDTGVELNGKIFDAVGLAGAGKKASEPKLAERAPLVPPPRTDALPAPGPIANSATHMAWPDDPDRRKAEVAAAESRTTSKYCSDAMFGRPDHERAKRDAECSAQQGGLLSSATAWFTGNSGKKEGAAAQTSDEGDPAIVTGSTKPQSAPSASKIR
jgi:hypothetical protein